MTRPTRLRFAALASVLCALPLAAAPALADAASDTVLVWPQWRGPERTGAVPAEASPWPSDLASLELAWRAPELGPSYSGPIVGPERIYITETRAEAHEVVTAYDRETGETVWSQRWKGSMKVPFFAARNGSWIRSTPALGGDTLYVGGILEVLVALDAATGAERWRIDFPARFGHSKPQFGFVCSPLLVGDHLYVEAAGSLFKIERSKGEIVWRAEGFSGGDMESDSTFSSPVMAQIAGEDMLVVQSRQELRGVDPATGEVLWRQPVPSFRGMNILTPTVWGDSVFTGTYRNNSFRFDVSKSADGWAVERAWMNEAQPYMSSPVVIDDIAYTHLGNGRLTAIELGTGERLWTSKPLGSYWSMVHRGEQILALSDEGELLLIAASPEEFRLLDRREVSSSETWAHLAVAGDLLVIRELDGLSVWRWGGGPAKKAPAAKPAAAP